MPIYPSKKVKSFRFGGRYAVPGAVDNPAVGIGLQYVPTQGIMPNVDAAMYLADSFGKSEAYLQQQRDKRKPQKDAIRDMIFKAPGTVGQKEKLWQETSAVLKEYENRSKEDPNWVFSDDGKESFQGIDDILSPAKFQKLTENNDQLKLAYEQSYKNKTLDQFHIKGDQISVADKDGVRRDISLGEYEQDQSSEKPQYTALKVRDVYDKAINEQSYDLSGHAVHGDLYNVEQAKAELANHFSNIGYTLDDTGHQDNRSQLNQAKRQAKEMLSADAKAALVSEYMQVAGGAFRQKEFDKYLDNVLDREKNKRIISRDKSGADALAKAKAKAQQEAASRILPTEVPVNTDYPVMADTAPINLRNEHVDLHLVSVGTPTDKTPRPLALNGDYYAFGDDTWFFGKQKFSEEMGGKPVKITNQTYRNASHTENATFAVTSNWMMKRQKDGTLKRVEVPAGRIVMKGAEKGYAMKIPKGAQMQESDEGYTYFEDKDGNHVVVEMRGFKVYDIYGGDDKESEKFEKTKQVLVPMNRRESIASLGSNYSGERINKRHWVGNQITRQANDVLMQTVSYYDQHSPETANKLRQEFARANAGDTQAKERINSLVNSQLDYIEDKRILDDLITPKATHTIKDATDNRNLE